VLTRPRTLADGYRTSQGVLIRSLTLADGLTRDEGLIRKKRDELSSTLTTQEKEYLQEMANLIGHLTRQG
jgi:hypothetical protein